MADDDHGLESPIQTATESPTTTRSRPGQRKAWLHLGTSSSSTIPASSPSSITLRKRPGPLTNIELLDSKSHATTTTNSTTSSVSEGSRFPFISPVEPLMTLARFHRSLNKVYIPLDEEEELEVVRTKPTTHCHTHTCTNKTPR